MKLFIKNPIFRAILSIFFDFLLKSVYIRDTIITEVSYNSGDIFKYVISNWGTVRDA